MAILLLRSRDGRPREVPLGDRQVLGRHSSCEIRLPDDRVSRRHAEIWREGDDYFVRDLGSKNGTRVNRRRVDEARLAFGDEIGLGRTRLFFTEHAPSELVGSVIGRYQVNAQIGSGGMGVVYRAVHADTGRDVALKVLHPRLAADQKFVDRFLREAHAAGSLDHPNVVRVYESGRADDTYFYAMEYVHGPTVAEELRRSGALEPDQALLVAIDIGNALAYAHSRGIIHRDVKPENIMLGPKGAKLADLGLAKFLEARASDIERGADGRARVWGTPAYIAPEAARGQEADGRSDLYSLGATLFHMLTGRVPFLGSTVTEVLTQHVREPLPALESILADVPTELNPIVARLMAKNPDQRYQVGDDLVRDLETARRTLSLAAGADETRSATPVPGARKKPTSIIRRLWHRNTD